VRQQSERDRVCVCVRVRVCARARSSECTRNHRQCLPDAQHVGECSHNGVTKWVQSPWCWEVRAATIVSPSVYSHNGWPSACRYDGVAEWLWSRGRGQQGVTEWVWARGRGQDGVARLTPLRPKQQGRHRGVQRMRALQR
jgi:hypothetical protein